MLGEADFTCILQKPTAKVKGFRFQERKKVVSLIYKTNKKNYYLKGKKSMMSSLNFLLTCTKTEKTKLREKIGLKSIKSILKFKIGVCSACFSGGQARVCDPHNLDHKHQLQLQTWPTKRKFAKINMVILSRRSRAEYLCTTESSTSQGGW